MRAAGETLLLVFLLCWLILGPLVLVTWLRPNEGQGQVQDFEK